MAVKSLAGSPQESTTRSTRHIRCDYEFLGLLNEDFGIDYFSLNRSLMGMPSVPKKQAIKLCEWAIRVAEGDAYEAGKALRAWAKKRGKGQYGMERHDIDAGDDEL